MSANMIHGDISPDNIYLQESGMGRNGESSLTVILDFGSVQELDDGGREYLPIYAKTDYVHPDITKKGKRNILEKMMTGMACFVVCGLVLQVITVIEYAPVESIYEVEIAVNMNRIFLIMQKIQLFKNKFKIIK